MSKHEFINRNILIINFLKRGKTTWNDIIRHLEIQSEISGYNYVISKRQFQRDLNDIRNLWNCDIECNKSTGFYSITENDQENENVQLLDAFNLYSTLSLSHNYTQFIQFENRTPKGTEHFSGLLHAIKNRYVVEINYQKFYEDKPEKVIINPYLIKQFKGRWYLLCIKESSGHTRTYGLDRILDVEIKKKKFSVSKDLNLTNYFKNYFGIITPEKGQPEKIKFSFNSGQAHYIINYPLHSSQKVISETANTTTFEITLFITYDLIMELLSYGEEITIITPKSLVKEIVGINKAIEKKY